MACFTSEFQWINPSIARELESRKEIHLLIGSRILPTIWLFFVLFSPWWFLFLSLTTEVLHNSRPSSHITSCANFPMITPRQVELLPQLWSQDLVLILLLCCAYCVLMHLSLTQDCHQGQTHVSFMSEGPCWAQCLPQGRCSVHICINFANVSPVPTICQPLDKGSMDSKTYGPWSTECKRCLVTYLDPQFRKHYSLLSPSFLPGKRKIVLSTSCGTIRAALWPIFSIFHQVVIESLEDIQLFNSVSSEEKGVWCL